MVFGGVADSSDGFVAVIRQLGAQEVDRQVICDVLFFLCWQIVKGVLGDPVVGAIIGVCWVC